MGDITERERVAEEAKELGRQIAEEWLMQRAAIVAFMEGLSEGLRATAAANPDGKVT